MMAWQNTQNITSVRLIFYFSMLYRLHPTRKPKVLHLRAAQGAGLLPLERHHAPGREAAQRDDRPRAKAAQADRLGFGGVLPPGEGVQRASGVTLLQGVCACIFLCNAGERCKHEIQFFFHDHPSKNVDFYLPVELIASHPQSR